MRYGRKWRCSGARRVGCVGGFGHGLGWWRVWLGLMARREVGVTALLDDIRDPAARAARPRCGGAGRACSLAADAHDDPALNHDG